MKPAIRMNGHRLGAGPDVILVSGVEIQDPCKTAGFASAFGEKTAMQNIRGMWREERRIS
jgi:hypothetical protein